MKCIKFLVILSVLIITGCGTVHTVILGDNVVKTNLQEIDTKCDSIPRVYSGLSYDFCYLHARPVSTYEGPSTNSAPLIFFDMIFSALIDTVLLPYSVYKQTQDGSIKVKER